MADCCVNGLNQVFCNAFNKYYNTLYTNGEISKEETNNLLIIDYIRQCLSDDRYNSYYNILLKALRCIANNSCLLDTSWLYDRSIVPKVTNQFVTVLIKQTFKETDPIFKASPAATITEEDIDNWNNSSGGEQSDWDETDTDSLAYIKNKPTIPAAQVQSNWNESNTSSKAYIQNKPTIPTVPTNVSAFNNDAGYLTQHQSIKTVNNTSLVGNGNISTETPVVEVSGAAVTQTLSHNTFYKFTGAVTSLTLTLGSEVSGIANIYAFRFTAGQDNPTITLPQGVVCNQDLSLKTGDVCEFSIMDNQALFSVWEAQS